MPFCHNCGTQVSETTKFCPSCGTSYQNTQFSQQTVPPPHPSSPPIQNTPVTHTHQNVVIMGKAKSVGVAFVLAFFFGPLGLLYASVVGGIVMIIVNLFFVLIFFPGLILTQIVCIIWACVAADQANQKLRSQGQGLINNQFR